MDERPITEIKLPDCEATVYAYSFMRHGDFRQIRRALLESIKVHVEKDELVADNVDATISYDQQDLVAKFLVKEIVTKEGIKIDTPETMVGFIYDISIRDGEYLTNKLNDIYKESQLSQEAKKK